MTAERVPAMVHEVVGHGLSLQCGAEEVFLRDKIGRRDFHATLGR